MLKKIDKKYIPHLIWGGVSLMALFIGTAIGEYSSKPSYLDLLGKEPQVRTGYLEKKDENNLSYLLVELKDRTKEVLQSRDGTNFRNIEDITQEQNQELINRLKQNSIIDNITE